MFTNVINKPNLDADLTSFYAIMSIWLETYSEMTYFTYISKTQIIYCIRCSCKSYRSILLQLVKNCGTRMIATGKITIRKIDNGEVRLVYIGI